MALAADASSSEDMMAVNTNKRMEIPFSAKSFNEATGEFVGYGATYDLDLQRDRIQPGAFAMTIDQANRSRKKRNGVFTHVLLWMHQPDSPIGGITEISEDQRGLRIEGLLDLDTEQGRRAFSAMSKGYMRELSIGYKPRFTHMEQGGVRVLESIDLLEISLVTFAANPEARISSVKAIDKGWLKKLLLDMEQTVARHGAQKRSIGMTDYNRPAFSRTAESGVSYRIEPGLDPMEDRKEFEKELRKQLREEDAELYTLHGKAFDREVELRRKQREQRQAEQQAALDAERRERAEKQAAMAAETFTAESFAQASGLDVIFVRRWFAHIARSEGVTPVDADGLVLRSQDVRAAARRDHELIETQAISMRNKRLERAA